MEKAILIPMNEEGGISAREAIIRRQGALFWRLIAPGGWVAAGFPHPEIHKGYIYNVSAEKVTHECEITWVKPMSQVPFDDSQKYGIGMYKHRDEYATVAGRFYAINIVAIRPLGQPLSLSAFRKRWGRKTRQVCAELLYCAKSCWVEVRIENGDNLWIPLVRRHL